MMGSPRLVTAFCALSLVLGLGRPASAELPPQAPADGKPGPGSVPLSGAAPEVPTSPATLEGKATGAAAGPPAVSPIRSEAEPVPAGESNRPAPVLLPRPAPPR